MASELQTHLCLLHESGPGPFLQPEPCLASSVEGAGELSQEERVLLLDSVPSAGPGLRSAQQPAATGRQKLPPALPWAHS